jgi:N6-adenosine-specific RNA methylase IME4
MKYRTIVADPPWPFTGTGARTESHSKWGASAGTESKTPYAVLTVDEIAALPVSDLAERDAHLYLWTFGAFIPRAYDVARAWGFVPSALLTWCKEPMGLGFGGAFVPSAEHVLFCRRGVLPHKTRWRSTWFQFKRPGYNQPGYGPGPAHSAKPDGFLDIVEQVSPGPYVELFARRHRLGWDVWGNESANTASLETA